MASSPMTSLLRYSPSSPLLPPSPTSPTSPQFFCLLLFLRCLVPQVLPLSLVPPPSPPPPPLQPSVEYSTVMHLTRNKLLPLPSLLSPPLPFLPSVPSSSSSPLFSLPSPPLPLLPAVCNLHECSPEQYILYCMIVCVTFLFVFLRGEGEGRGERGEGKEERGEGAGVRLSFT